MNSFSRRSFLKSAGVATGAAAISASPAVAAAIEPDTVQTAPTGKIAPEPVVAIVRDPGLGEITVLSGTTESTYQDRALVRRLLKVAAAQSRRQLKNGGVA
jgi:hypothetical protein